MSRRIINSLLQTDKYKFTMLYYSWKYKKDNINNVTWEMKNRTKNIDVIDPDSVIRKSIMNKFKQQIDMLDGLMFRNDEIDYIVAMFVFGVDKEFIEYLKDFKLNSKLVNIEQLEDDYRITVTGSLLDTTLWETYLLSIYNELFTMKYAEMHHVDVSNIGRDNIDKVIRTHRNLQDADFKVVEFGTRRRAHSYVQADVIKDLASQNVIIGTSNVEYSKTFKLDCFGTIAHELFMYEAACADLENDDKLVRDSQLKVINQWNELFNGVLNTFLSDTFGTKAFCEDIKQILANKPNFKIGVRHDSGDPIVFANAIKNLYDEVGRDSKEHVIMFSDGLNINSAIDIYQKVKSICKPTFGIGTSLTNNVGVPTLSLVCKLYSVEDKQGNVRRAVKLSDNINKATGDKETIDRYVRIFEYVNDVTNNTALLV